MLTRKEVAQPEDYIAELRSGNHVQATTRFDAFVLASQLAPDGVGERNIGQPTNAVIRPMTYTILLKRAHARTFNLLNKVRQSFPEAKPDADVEAAVVESRTLFDDSEKPKQSTYEADERDQP